LPSIGGDAPTTASSTVALTEINSVRRPINTAFVALAIALAAAPAVSQQQRPAKADRVPVGLRIFTSDGKAIGKVLATGIDDDDKAVLVAEIERPLGIGADAVAIPTEMFIRKFNRIVLTITEAEVRDKLARAEHKR
jgi:hypothetical protein